MPTVPRDTTGQVVPFAPKLPEPWALMAAAQMHSEGRLVDTSNQNAVPDGQRTDHQGE